MGFRVTPESHTEDVLKVTEKRGERFESVSERKETQQRVNHYTLKNRHIYDTTLGGRLLSVLLKKIITWRGVQR